MKNKKIKTNMKFHEEDLFFNFEAIQEKSIFDDDLPSSNIDPEILGVKMRLGNEPIVRNLKKLIELSHAVLPPEIELLFQDHDIFMITHAIGILRLNGHAKVQELQYNAEVINLNNAQTIDLLPNTRFKTVFEVNSSIEGTLKASGNFSASIPDELKNALSGKSISLGGDIELNLSLDAKFVGKIDFSVKLPVVTSSGVSSNKCTWILNPDSNPLLGDQLLIQTIAVPKNTSSLTYQIKGLVKINPGLFSKTKEQSTSTQTIYVPLN